MRTFSTIAAAVLVIVLAFAAAIAMRAGSMKPADVAEEWEEFKLKTIEPLQKNGFLQPWRPTKEERFQEEGFLREPAAGTKKAE